MKRQPPPTLVAAVDSVRIERRGGLAGLHACAEPSPAGMTPEQWSALGELLARPVLASPAPSGPDRFHYRVRLGLADGAERLIELPEEAMPEVLAALVRPTFG